MAAPKFRVGINERPPIAPLLVYATQWVAFATYPLMFGLAFLGLGWNLDGPTFGKFIAATLLMIGLGTVLQAFLGHALCMVSGPFLLTIFAMLEAHRSGHDVPAIFGAIAVSGVTVAIFGALRLVDPLRRVFSPLVIGTLVMMIGLASAPYGIRLMVSGGMGPTITAFVLAILCGVIAIRLRGFVASVPVLLIVIVGYIIFALAPGWWKTPMAQLPWLNIPRPALLGVRWPPLELLVTFCLVQLASAAFGLAATMGAAEVLGERLSGGALQRQTVINSLGEGTFAALMSVAPQVAYPGSLGFVAMTRVASRWAMAAGGVLLMVLSFFGPLSALLAAIPRPLAGAVVIAIAGMNIGLGAEIWVKRTRQFGTREAFTVGFAVFFGVGLAALPADALRGAPATLELILRNPLLSAMIVVILLDGLIFRQASAATPDDGD